MGWQDDDEGYPEFREPSPEEEADYQAYLAWAERERAAGREREPEPWETVGPAVSLSLGDAADLDPALLAAIGAGRFCGEAIDGQWAQGKAAAVLRPGPVLAALTAQAVSDAARLSDDELLGALGAAVKLENHAAAQQAVLIGEFARRRRAVQEAAWASWDPAVRRAGEQHPDAELAMELVCSANCAADLMDEAVHLTTRLPATLAGMTGGSIDYGRALIIHRHTQFLGDADAARADAILAAAAPDLRHDQLQRKAAALEMKLDPAAVRRRRERAAKDGRRVEVRREYSGNAAIAGRELDPADVLAAKANIDALAAALRSAGVPGTLQHLRARALTELLQGRDPLHLASQPTATAGGEPPEPAEPAGADSPGDSAPGKSAPGDCAAGAPGEGAAGAGAAGPAGGFPDSGYTDEPDDDDDEDPDQAGDSTRRGPAAPARSTGPVPAAINLLVPAGTLFGWSNAPAEAGGWGLLDAAQTRDLLAAASRHPATRWCWTLLNPDGTAAAHACAPGHHPWPPPGPRDQQDPGDQPCSHEREDPRDPAAPGGSRDGPDSAQAARLAAFLASLGATLRPIARGSCDHAHAEDRYTPSRSLKHLIRARTARCPAPGCDAQAATSDADHTIPWPAGPTDQCNLSPPCRRHHRVKQAPGWRLQQPEPGVMVWTTPSGRTYTTTPTVYEI